MEDAPEPGAPRGDADGAGADWGPRANEDLLRRVLARADDLLLVNDPDGNIIEVNAAWRDLGYEPEALVGVSAWDLVIPEDRARRREMGRIILDYGYVIRTIRMYTASGEQRPIRWMLHYDKETDRGYGIGRDLAVEQERLRELRDSHRFIESAEECMSVTDLRGHLRRGNRALFETLGYEPSELLDRDLMECVHPEDYDIVAGTAIEASMQGTRTRATARWRTASGEYRWFDTTYVVDPVDDNLHAVSRDVTEERRLQDALHLQANTDRLTGLSNRWRLLSRLEEAVDAQRAVALVLLDLDRFKVVNDSLGHAAGDALLVQLGERLRSVAPPMSTVARLGGDEFVILAEGILDDRAAAHLAHAALATVHRPFEIEGRVLHSGASAGVAISLLGDRSAADLLREADTAVYRAKELGRGSMVVYDDELRSLARHRLDLEAGLRRALDNDELAAVYQPIVRLSDRRIVAAEALVRWYDPYAGERLPGAFIGLAEETGLIVPLGLKVLTDASRRLAAWVADGHDVGMTVNVSARQLNQPDFAASVALVVAETGVDPSRLTLEVTESALLGDLDDARSRLDELHAIGVKLAIDDFGTGFSSLSYLRHLPLDTVKVDRSFVTDVDQSETTRAIVSSVVALAHALGLRVIAEGVGSDEQADVLSAIGCAEAQGFFLHRPQPGDAVAALLEAQRPAAIPVPGPPTVTEGTPAGDGGRFDGYTPAAYSNHEEAHAPHRP